MKNASPVGDDETALFFGNRTAFKKNQTIYKEGFL